MVLRGGATGVVTSGGQIIDKSVAGVPGDPAKSDGLGAALAGANVMGSTKADLIVGVPGQKVGTATQAGSAMVLSGATGGVSTSGVTEWNQDRPSVPDTAEPSDRLGSNLSVGRWRGGSFSDFAAGVPSEDSSTLTDVGAVSTFVGASALSGSGSVLWTQNSSGVPDVSEAGDGFGGAFGLGG